jgi:hypothetical protein
MWFLKDEACGVSVLIILLARHPSQHVCEAQHLLAFQYYNSLQKFIMDDEIKSLVLQPPPNLGQDAQDQLSDDENLGDVRDWARRAKDCMDKIESEIPASSAIQMPQFNRPLSPAREL